MSARLTTAVGILLLLGSATIAHADVELTIRDGRVSLVATGATLQEILAEWERVGRTRIINADRVTGGPLTLRLDDMPESQALGVLLRTVNGYVAAPRPIADAGASRFDRIMIMPGTPRPRVASMTPAPFATSPPAVDVPLFEQPFDEPAGDPNGERPVRTVPAPAARGSVFGVFPRPQVETPPPAPRTPASAGQPSGTPVGTVPAGVAVPGMIVPAPPDQDQAPDR